MKIQTAAIIGAGAIGAYFVWGLTPKLGNNLCLIADGERKERLEKNGIIINGKVYKPLVKTPAEAHGTDLVLVATKYNSLNQILDGLKTIVSENTIVLSLLNGIDSEDIISTAIDKKHIVYSLMRIASERKGNSIVFDEGTTAGLYYGEADTKEETPRLKALGELFEDTPVAHHFMPDIITDQWVKFMSNMANNLPQAILGVGYGAYADSEHVLFISKRIKEEVMAVAAAKNIFLEDKPNPNTHISSAARFSTLQDIDAKRATEIDMFAGVMIKLGKQYNIPVPYCEYTYHAIKALEEKNAGKFDY